MNFASESNQDSSVFFLENSAGSYETSTASYGLDSTETTSLPLAQLDFIQSSNLELAPVKEHVTSSLVFIDSTVEDIETLTNNISGATEVIVLDSDQDELLQISKHLSNYEDLDAVHIVSHGESGQLSFGNATLNSDTLPEYKELLKDWSLSLDSEADLLLYGCNLTSDAKGTSFIQELSQITDADISASVDDTGISGDWELETAIGEVEATSIFSDEIKDAYQHDLDYYEDSTYESNISFAGDEFFDADYYLEQKPELAFEDIDLLEHYAETGFQEGLDPNKFFDTSFYLEENPDVAEALINPYEHYYENAASDDVIRYPNQDLKTIGTSKEGVIVTASDLSNVDIGAIKSFAEITETENPEIALAPAIPIVYYTIIGGIAITVIGIELIRNSDSIADWIEGGTTYTITTDNGGIDTSIPPFDLGETVTIKPETLPNGDRFIEDILNGRYEFPDSDEVLFTDNFDSISKGNSDIFKDDSLWGDSDVINNPSNIPIPEILNPEAEDIANGHAFPKHRHEFPGVETREDFAKIADKIMNDRTVEKKDLKNDRKAYWQQATGTLVIINPNDPDGSTMYKPVDGKAEYDKLI